MLGCGIFGWLKSLATNYLWFAVAEFFDAGIGSGISVSIFILGVELVGPAQRVLFSTLSFTCFAFGGVLLGVVAMYTQDYQMMLRILYTPSVLVLTYIWLMPESIRWLLIAGHKRKAVDILLGAAVMNKIKYSERVQKTLQQQQQQDHMQFRATETVSFLTDEKKSSKTEQDDGGSRQIFKSSILMKRILNCSFCWLTNTFVFYGLSLNSVTMPGNKYVNYMTTSLAEVPGYFLVLVLLNRLGRRLSLSGSLLIAGMACIVTAAMSASTGTAENGLARLSAMLVGKFAVTISFTVLYLYTTEIFPTSMRNGLMSICSTIGRIGSMLAPQTPLLVCLCGFFILLQFFSLILIFDYGRSFDGDLRCRSFCSEAYRWCRD